MNRIIKRIRMCSFEYTPYNFTGIQFLPNESLKRELKLWFLLINCSLWRHWKFTVQNCSGDGKKLIYSFKSDTKIHNHFAAPIQLQILSKKLQNTKLSYTRTFNILISSLMRRKNYSEFSYEKFNMLHAVIFSSLYLALNT